MQLAASCSAVNSLRSAARIYISHLSTIFANLAIEEWLFRNHNLVVEDALLIWSNNPAVVIGRHQNPWIECNLRQLTTVSASLARRYSGGGTVYHDQGNINLSVITTQDQHCRSRNLRWICEALNRKYVKLQMCPNVRDDIELQPGNRKVSGTAARITRQRAYHHLTLMVDVDRRQLSNTLRSSLNETNVITNATRSTRAVAVGCLIDDEPTIDRQQVVDAIVDAYSKQYHTFETTTINRDTYDRQFVGIDTIECELRSWDWIFGKTPKFQFINDNKSVITVDKGIILSVDDDDDYLVGNRFNPLC